MPSNRSINGDKRQAIRRPIPALAVSIRQRTAMLRSSGWLFGEIRDVSTTGARIGFATAPVLDMQRPIELLCFPGNRSLLEDRESTPYRLNGRIVWSDNASCEIGIVFVP